MSFFSSSSIDCSISRNSSFFSRKFRLLASTDCFALYVAREYFNNAFVAIYKTSANCYRVMSYYVRRDTVCSEYKSFVRVSELCSYLDTLRINLV